jgi:molybdopterin synthase catalytic subunit
MMVELVRGPIDAEALAQAVGWEGAGAVLVFSGVGRSEVVEGRRVLSLFYEAYEEMAIPVLREIEEEVRALFPGARVAMVHRLGEVAIGEASVVIAVSAPHRDECYRASRHAIDELKHRAPIWKKEIFSDGAAWKANA